MLLEVLGGLEHPAVRPAQVAEHLQLAAEEGVVPALVEAEVVIPPGGHPGMPLEGVRAEVEVDQLAVLLDAPRRPVVHQGRQRGHLLVSSRWPGTAGSEDRRRRARVRRL